MNSNNIPPPVNGYYSNGKISSSIEKKLIDSIVSLTTIQGLANIDQTNAGELFQVIWTIAALRVKHIDSYKCPATLSTREGCDLYIKHNPDLVELLAEVHERKAYAWFCETFQLKISRSEASDLSVENRIDKFVETLRPKIRHFLTQPRLPIWVPPGSVDEEIRKFYADLAIPLVNGQPSLLLHNLGVIPNPNVDKFLQGDKHRILWNASGSGKTRLLLELLCRHWGFYFVVAQGSDGIGAPDLEALIDRISATSKWISDIFESRDPNKVSNANTSNEGIVFNRISKVLLARRIVFRAFIEESRVLNDGALHEQIKLDWLLLQILPLVHVEDKDPFTALIHSCLIGATDGHLDSLNFGLAPTSVLGSAFNPTVDKFFHILDEAQVAGKQYMGAFADADSEVPRSVLSPIARHLTTLDDPLVRVIVSGTGFSLEQFKNVLESGVSKGEDPWDLEHTTGDFTDQNMQLAYIPRYLPPSFLLSPSGEILKTRMYEWLRGRYRFTARFLEELLSGHWETYRPASPHKLLNAYVYTLAYFTPLDGDKTLMKSEPDVEPIGVQGFYWEKFERSPQKLDLFNQLAHLIFTYITRGPYPMGYYELKPLVEYGLARFIKRDTITVEEPLAIVSIVLYFKFKRFILDEDTYARLQDDKGRVFKELVLLKITKPLWNGQTLRSIF